MLEWLRKKLEVLLPIFIVISIIADGIISFIVCNKIGNAFFGYGAGAFFGLIGLVLSVLLAVLASIFAFGVVACIISITNTNEQIATSVNRLLKQVDDIAHKDDTAINTLQTLLRGIRGINDIAYSQQQTAHTVSASATETKVQSSTQTLQTEAVQTAQENKPKTFSLITVANKTFAVAAEDKTLTYYCPKCHVCVTTDAFSCNNCNTNFVTG